MAKRKSGPKSASRGKASAEEARVAASVEAVRPGKASSLLDTRVICCGDCQEQLEKLPDNCIDLLSMVV